jgi:UDP-2,3-diacylglucosamine pyrophosphatase LpxH
MVIVAVSDVHLGYEHSDYLVFSAFLDYIKADDSVTHLVLLGDIVDMWRRDASGVFLENREIFDKIALLQKKMNVYYVAGNHDFHVNKLKNTLSYYHYPFEFNHHDCQVYNDCLIIKDGNRQYRFLHGHQFDLEQTEEMSDALCRTMSDTVGDFESGVYATFTRGWTDLHYFFARFFEKGKIRKKSEGLQIIPEKRLAVDKLDSVERTACSKVNDGEILVFGHTHKPFISARENVVNTGSWVTEDSKNSHDTFVRFEANGPHLFEFKTAINIPEIKIRKDCLK